MTAPAIQVSRPSPLSRAFGLGSVFGKTLRDSRRSTIIVGLAVGLLILAVSAGIVSQFGTAEARDEIGNIVDAVPPIMQGLAGKPVNVETLGGYLQYKYGGFLPLVIGLWSILALSGTLAAETRRGSLDILLAAPISRRRVAWEKVLGHVLMVALAMTIIGTATAIAGSSFASLPGDAISVGAAFGFAAWLGLMALAAGSVAFVLAPFVGRGSAAGIAGGIMLAGFLLNGYQTAIPELAPFANLTWFGWTADHIPLANQFDWASLALVAVLTIVPARRRSRGLRPPRHRRRHRAFPGRASPTSCSACEDPSVGPAASGSRPAWRGASASACSGSSSPARANRSSSRSAIRRRSSEALATLFPGIDMGTIGGFLQLVFVEFGLVLAGLAAAGLVGGWVSDERSGRMEMLLPTPVARSRWPLSGGIAVFAAIGVLVAVTAAGLAIGTASAGGEVWTPVLGTAAIGLYAAALAGVGMAIGGVIRPGPRRPGRRRHHARDVADRPGWRRPRASLTRFMRSR